MQPTRLASVSAARPTPRELRLALPGRIRAGHMTQASGDGRIGTAPRTDKREMNRTLSKRITQPQPPVGRSIQSNPSATIRGQTAVCLATEARRVGGHVYERGKRGMYVSLSDENRRQHGAGGQARGGRAAEAAAMFDNRRTATAERRKSHR